MLLGEIACYSCSSPVSNFATIRNVTSEQWNTQRCPWFAMSSLLLIADLSLIWPLAFPYSDWEVSDLDGFASLHHLPTRPMPQSKRWMHLKKWIFFSAGNPLYCRWVTRVQFRNWNCLEVGNNYRYTLMSHAFVALDSKSLESTQKINWVWTFLRIFFLVCCFFHSL